MEPQRQIASVLFADVAGYSKLNEAQLKIFLATVLPAFESEVLQKYRRDFLELNTWGDGVVIASTDPYSLAQLALDFRDFYRNRHWAHDNLPKLSVRIALHAGSVYVGHDPVRGRNGIVGSQVNLTARLEPVVDPDEIAVTQQFYGLIPLDQELPFGFDDLGEKPLAKNYGKIHTHRLRRLWEKTSPGAQQPAAPAPAEPAKPALEQPKAEKAAIAIHVSHPLRNKGDRGPMTACQFVIMFPRFTTTGRWNALGDVLVEVMAELPEWAQEAYLIPSARAHPQFRDSTALKAIESPGLLKAKKDATLRFADERKFSTLEGVWFAMPVTKGQAIGVYCLDYDLFLNASVTEAIESNPPSAPPG